MAYSRVKKYQELRDGLKDEAGINKEQVLIDKTEDEDDDFLSFIKKDDHADKKANIEDTLTEPKHLNRCVKKVLKNWNRR